MAGILDEYRLGFFSTWSRESAWVYGLILGDGGVYRNNGYRVMFFGNGQTVRHFCRLLRIDNKKMKPKSNGYEVYFDGKATASWFIARGIDGKKSYNLPWPEDLPEDFKWDFIRGIDRYRWNDDDR